MFTVTLHWWMIPLAITILGILIAKSFFDRNYQPSGYFGDWMTPLVSALIFFIFLSISIGIVVGRYLR